MLIELQNLIPEPIPQKIVEASEVWETNLRNEAFGDHHVGKHQGGYTIFDTSCEDEKHHATNHQCQKCLNKNQKLHSIKEIDNSINQRKICYRTVKNIIDVKSIIFDLNSRPPPSLI